MMVDVHPLINQRITHVILIDLGVQKVHLVQRHVRVLKHGLLEFVLGTALKYGIHQVHQLCVLDIGGVLAVHILVGVEHQHFQTLGVDLRQIQIVAVVPERLSHEVEVVIVAELVEQCTRVGIIIGIHKHIRRGVTVQQRGVARSHFVCAAAEAVQVVFQHVGQRVAHGGGISTVLQRLFQHRDAVVKGNVRAGLCRGNIAVIAVVDRVADGGQVLLDLFAERGCILFGEIAAQEVIGVIGVAVITQLFGDLHAQLHQFTVDLSQLCVALFIDRIVQRDIGFLRQIQIVQRHGFSVALGRIFGGGQLLILAHKGLFPYAQLFYLRRIELAVHLVTLHEAVAPARTGGLAVAGFQDRARQFVHAVVQTGVCFVQSQLLGFVIFVRKVDIVADAGDGAHGVQLADIRQNVVLVSGGDLLQRCVDLRVQRVQVGTCVLQRTEIHIGMHNGRAFLGLRLEQVRPAGGKQQACGQHGGGRAAGFTAVNHMISPCSFFRKRRDAPGVRRAHGRCAHTGAPAAVNSIPQNAGKSRSFLQICPAAGRRARQKMG